MTRVGLAHIATGMVCLLACTDLHNKLLMNAHWWGLDMCVDTVFPKACSVNACAAIVQHCSDINPDCDV